MATEFIPETLKDRLEWAVDVLRQVVNFDNDNPPTMKTIRAATHLIDLAFQDAKPSDE